MVNYHIQNYQIINRKAFKRIRWDQSYLRFSSNLRSSNNFDRFEDNGCYSDLSSPCITTRRTRHGDKWNSKRFVVEFSLRYFLWMKSYRPMEHVKVLNSRLITGSFLSLFFLFLFFFPSFFLFFFRVTGSPRRPPNEQTTILDHVPIMSLQRVISRPTDK